MSKLITKKDFLVKIAKGSGIVEFTEQHLKIHLQHFNENNRPEYFGDLQPIGLDYIGTELREAAELKAVAMSQQNQPFRKGKNPKYNEIKTSMIDEVGMDLREKPIQALVDDDGNIEVLFNGNTTNDIHTRYTNLQNRLVAIYKKNSKFSYAKLKLIGGYSNNLDYASGTLSFPDLCKIVTEYLIESGIIERFKKGVISETDFYSEIEDAFAVLNGGKEVKKDTKEYRKYVIKTRNDAVGDESMYSVDNGKEVMKNLRETFPEKYTDNENSHYISISANMDKYFDILETKDRNLTENFENGVTDINPSDVNVNVIVHMGAPDPENSISSLFDTYIDFYIEYLQIHRFLEKSYYHTPFKRNRHNLVGLYQQVRELDVFEFGSVITFDALIKEYEKRNPQSEKLVKIKKLKSLI